MKKILFAIAILFSFSASAQLDSLTLTYAENPITVQVPVKAVVLYANYMSETPSWKERKAPDYFLGIIGSGTKPDSLVTVTLSADNLASFAIKLIAERYGAIDAVNHSIFNNTPQIPAYTALFSQVVGIANGAGPQKNAGTYVVAKYNAYSTTMENTALEMWNRGINWIRN